MRFLPSRPVAVIYYLLLLPFQLDGGSMTAHAFQPLLPRIGVARPSRKQQIHPLRADSNHGSYNGSGHKENRLSTHPKAPPETTEIPLKRSTPSSSSVVGKIRLALARLLDYFRGQLFVRLRGQYGFRVRKLIRSMVEKYTIYVLECENGKYYVGSTQNKKQRFQEHLDGGRASVWTKGNRPLRVLQQYTRVRPQYALGLESKVTAEAMLQYGVNNVRGAMFADPKPYTLQNLDALTRFLGHYNNLNYGDVREQLQSVLPQSPSKQAKRRRKKRESLQPNKTIGKNDRCFHCGGKGHWAMECPKIGGQQGRSLMGMNQEEMPEINGNSKKVLPTEELPTMARLGYNVIHLRKVIDPNDRCFKCGDKGHWAAECPN